MKVKFSNGITLELPLREEVQAEEFSALIAAAKSMVACGLKQQAEVEQFASSDNKEQSQKATKTIKGMHLNEEQLKVLALEVNQLREQGKTDHEIALRYSKYKNYVCTLGNKHPDLFQSRKEWEAQHKMKAV